MAIFNWFGEQEHNVFDYKPIYYDKEKDEIKRRFASVDGSMDKKDEDGKPAYVPGSYIQGSFRGGNYQKSKRAGSRLQGIIGIISLLLVFVALYFITKFYSLL